LLVRLTKKDATGLKEPTFRTLLMTTVRLGVPAGREIKMFGDETIQPVQVADVMTT
jgi:hypothetical protein